MVSIEELQKYILSEKDYLLFLKNMLNLKKTPYKKLKIKNL